MRFSSLKMSCVPDNTPKTVILTTQCPCEECKYWVQSTLRSVQGVYSITVNADRNLITIAGNSAPKELIETLIKVSQVAEFCVKPPPHVPPVECPANMNNNCGLRTCSIPQAGCCPDPSPRCCACTGANRVGPGYYSGYHGRGRGHCHGRY